MGEKDDAIMNLTETVKNLTEELQKKERIIEVLKNDADLNQLQQREANLIAFEEGLQNRTKKIFEMKRMNHALYEENLKMKDRLAELEADNKLLKDEYQKVKNDRDFIKQKLGDENGK